MGVCNRHSRWWMRVCIATVLYQSEPGFNCFSISYSNNLLDCFSVMISIYFLNLHRRIKVFCTMLFQRKVRTQFTIICNHLFLEFPQIIVSTPLCFYTTFSKFWNTYIRIPVGTCLICMFSVSSCVCTPENKIWDKLSSTWSCFGFYFLYYYLTKNICFLKACQWL